MNNSIKVTIPFSFKGQVHEPSITLDLEHFCQKHTHFEGIYHQVATANGIDPYSYEYEVLESSPVFFSEPTGLAKDFLQDNTFDLTAFKAKHEEEKTLKLLQQIAQETLGKTSLDSDEKLTQALLKAYHAGQQARLPDQE